jgi:hypothetical protein
MLMNKKIRLRSDGNLLTEQEFRESFPDRMLPNMITPEVAAEYEADLIYETARPEHSSDFTSFVSGIEYVEEQWRWKWDVQPRPAETLQLELASQRLATLTRIDNDVDQVYGKVMGNRASEYALAEQEALAYQNADYSGEVPLSVSVWAQATGRTDRWAANDIIGTANVWRQAQIQIRAKRLKAKELVRVAADKESVNQAYADWMVALGEIRTALGLPQPVAR